jgi:hypothetical protein
VIGGRVGGATGGGAVGQIDDMLWDDRADDTFNLCGPFCFPNSKIEPRTSARKPRCRLPTLFLQVPHCPMARPRLISKSLPAVSTSYPTRNKAEPPPGWSRIV